MPTYEYACSKCGHTFEQFQSMNDKALTLCPRDLCARKRWGKGRVKRAIGAGAGLIFKGSGFYITDYRSEGYKAAAKKDSSAGTTPSADGKSSDKSATKPAKPESKPKPSTKPAASST